jgi:hypothetical protein
MTAEQGKETNQERLDRLTPRDRRIWELHQAGWPKAQIGYEVKFPAPHLIRTRLQRIRAMLEEDD